MAEILVVGKKISEMELVTGISGNEKIPTGVVGDKAVTTGQLVEYLNDNGRSVWGRIDGDLTQQYDLQNQFTQERNDLKSYTQEQVYQQQVALQEHIDATDEAFKYARDNGSALPYSEGITYEENAVVVKDGELQQWKDGVWKSAVAESLSDTIQTFNTPEAGVDPVTGVTDGTYFNVRSSSDESYIDEYQNVGGVPTPSGKSSPSSAALNNIQHDNLKGRDVVGSHPASAISYGAVNQKQYNDGLESIAEMLLIENPEDGMRVFVSGIRGGEFIYDSSRSLENDNGVIISGWVRQYAGDVWAEWFGADPTGQTDTSPLVEAVMSKYKSLNFGDGEFLFSTICGLPYQDNYSKNMAVIRGTGFTQFNFPASDEAIFTSDRAKLNPSSTQDLYTGKYTFTGINFFGLVGGVKVFNLDRIYNTFIVGNNFKNIDIVGLSKYPIAGTTGAYTQSVSFTQNHFADCGNVVKGVGAYNFTFNNNKIERCGDALVFIHDTLDCGLISFKANDNIHESAGVFLQCDHISGGEIASNYFEQNRFGSTPTIKATIKIKRKASYTAGLSIHNNFFDQKGSDPDFVDIILEDIFPIGNVIEALSPVSVHDNRTSSRHLLNQYAYVFQRGNSFVGSAALNDAKFNNSPFEPAAAKVHFWRNSISKTRDQAVDVVNGTLNIGSIDTSLMLQYFQSSNCNTATLDVKLDFMPNSDVTVGMAALKIEVMLFNTMGGYESQMQGIAPNEIHAVGKVTSFLQAPSTAVIEAARSSYFVPFFTADPTVSFVKNGSKYDIVLSNFTKEDLAAVYYGFFRKLRTNITAQVFMQSRTVSTKGSGGAMLRFSN